MTISNNISTIGVNDHALDLFEGQYTVPNGMAYNSYVVRGEKIAVIDTVDERFAEEWAGNLTSALGDRKPDYLVVQHMEPDHTGGIVRFMETYPEAVLVASSKAFSMMKNFFGKEYEDRRLTVGDGDTLSLGGVTLTFLTAPMIHWPEVIVTYAGEEKTLFSADAFGRFGALDTEEDEWACEARRYYFGIVGKYGAQVQNLLKKTAGLSIERICPLHGPVLTDGALSEALSLYQIWSSYGVESEGVVIAYASPHGHTGEAARLLARKLEENGCPKTVLHDLSRTDWAEAVEDAFRYGTLVLASSTYNADLFPPMRTFLHALTDRGFRGRRVALIENGSWVPVAAGEMKAMLEGAKNLTYARTTVKILSALNDESRAQIDALAKELCAPAE